MNDPAGTPAQIEVEDLEIRYGPVLAVKGVSFSVRAGEQLTLLGPSGCGKTTTLRAIAGLERPSAGAIRIGGRAVYSAREGVNVPAEKRGLSMVFQSYAIWPHMSVFDNVAYGLRVRRKSADEIRTRVREALELVQMAAFETRPASQLSGGRGAPSAIGRRLTTSKVISWMWIGCASRVKLWMSQSSMAPVAGVSVMGSSHPSGWPVPS